MANLKIYTENIENEAKEQIERLLSQPAFKDCMVRIMPDVHAGAGCVIGFTANLGDKVIPNIVGVDIGCGMLVILLGKINIDYPALDAAIRKFIPSGREVHTECTYNFNELQNLHCYDKLKDVNRLMCSIGTLGGGNHFIEIDEDDEGMKYLIIHTGSRNLGKQVAEYYQKLAIDNIHGKKELLQMQDELVARYKVAKRHHEIQSALEKLRKRFEPNPFNIPDELCYLIENDRDNYLHDMAICQRFAVKNRQMIAENILREMGWESLEQFETIHNYIEIETNMVRKGAISAKEGEVLLIPINMRDGCIIGRGKGNPEWNYSAPHGAGRLMSRSKAKESLTMIEFEDSMDGIWTSSVSEATLDESPMAYKPMDEILENIKDTVEIVKIIKPVYNFKASN